MRTISSWQILALGAAFALGAAGCRQAPVSQAASPGPVAEAAALWEEPQFTTMLRAYRDSIDRKSRVLRFEMDEHRASLQVQDAVDAPSAAAYEYWGGALRGPLRFNLAGAFANPNLDDDVFDWNGVAMERIPALVKAALSQAKLAGAQVVKVEIARRSARSEEIAARVDALVDASSRAMDQKLHRLEQDPTAGNPKGDPKAGAHTADSAPVASPMDVLEITVLLRAPGGMAWVAADPNGNFTGSGAGIPGGIEADLHETRPRFDVVDPTSTARPYWRRAAGLKP